jgi:hypothetical protein
MLKNKNDMKRIILIYGLIAGAIPLAMFFIAYPLYEKGIVDFDNGMVIGYASMVIAFSLIFFGVKNYRDNHLNGSISFGKAFKIGILVTLIASLLYAIGWEFYYNFFASDFMEKYSAHYLDKLAKGGASASEMEAARLEMAQGAEMYKNPLIRFAMTLMEIAPVGFVITLICAALLKRPQFMPKKP